ncbi:serine hydrolase domain-containing protein [Amycolatopsis mediterranei]|uniref:serine hydrolase domain-containing protein n=1 Tax=Amycolatopsis mediterranei TaxID=33910 RepID=UPI00342D3654
MKVKRTARVATAVALTSAAMVGALLTAGAESPAFATPHGTGHPPSSADRLQTAVNDLHALGITGVQGHRRIGNRTSTATSGVADLDTEAPVPANGHLRIGSETKTFVVVTLLQLVGEKRLSLDDSVEHWLPGVVSGAGNDGRTITVRQVLQHTSGLADYLDYVPLLRSEENFRADRFDHHDVADLVAIAMAHPPKFVPGAKWSYSNTNYLLAGMIIGKVTGHSWSDEVRARILKPLSLRQTYFPGDDPTIRSPHTKGYHQFVPDGPLVDTTEFNPTIADATGSLVSTPADLDRFWQAVQTGRLLTPALMKQMHETIPAPEIADALPGAQYGLGIYRVADSCGGYWSHPGNVPGMTVLNGISADGKRSVALFLNTSLANPIPVYQRATQFIDETLCR